MQQKIIAAIVSLEGLAAELALRRESKTLNLSFVRVDYL